MTFPDPVQASGPFWDDLNRNLADPEFAAEYARASAAIAETDEAANRALNARPREGRIIACLTLDIEPVPKARPRVSPAEYERAGGVRVRTKKAHGYTPKASARFEESVGWLLKGARVKRADEGDIAVTAVFHVRREADLDNLVKSLLDACNGIAWRDDEQVTRLSAELARGSDHPRIELTITELVSGGGE